MSLTRYKILRKKILSEFYELRNTLDEYLITPLNKNWYNIYIKPFAKVSYGGSITSHKSQASTYCNVFVDLDDIYDNNKNIDEMKRCLYTAMTRASSEIHIII